MGGRQNMLSDESSGEVTSREDLGSGLSWGR